MTGEILLNRYKLETELGKGGMGIVYKAHDTLLNRAVAIKFLNASGIGTEGKTRLLQEARAAAQLNHPNIVSVYDAGEVDGSAFIVMELVKGDTLRKIEKPNLPDALFMAQQICLALDHAHTNGIIHRDLKLENIIITDTQTLKLMDFGLARTADDAHLTEEGMLIGTLAYIAPELIQGQPASAQSDLYAFGVIFYELITGHAPFQGTINIILAQHLHRPVTPPSELNAGIPDWVNDIVLRLLSKRPEERPASAKDVLLLLEQRSSSPATTSLFSISPKSRNNLPIQLTAFIGREKEIEEVIEAIKNYRLVTLTGSGGTGKTRLSLQVAENLLDLFEYIWFVELAPISDPANIPQAILFAMGLSEQQGKTAQELINEYLQEKNTLIVLDNCEHLIEASAKISYALLNHAPALKILASSREALGVKGETAWHVPSLSVPDINHLPEFNELSQYESIRLFVERATLANPNFTTTKENASFIAQICSRLDGIPLAIELAASRVKALSVDQIAARLDDRFRLLTGGSRTSLPRQQTLRATIDWSYNLLTEPERALLRHLTVFSGGWTLEAAESVCGENGSEFDVLDLLTQLVDKSLVNLKDSRYRILETTRQYAREKLLDSGEATAMHDKHLNYFLDLVNQAEQEIHGRHQVEWLDRLETEHDNYRAALDWCVSSRHTESALHLISSFSGAGRLWSVRGYFSEARNWFDEVKALPVLSQHLLVYANALNGMSLIASFQSDYSVAILLAEESQHICETLGVEGELGLADALSAIGLAESWSVVANISTRAETCYEQADAIYQRRGDRWQQAFAKFSLGTTANRRNDFEQAQTLFEDSLMIFKEYEDTFGLARVHVGLGWLYSRQGNFELARKMQEKVLIYNRRLRFWFGLYADLIDICITCRTQGDYDQAEAYLKEGLRIGYEFNFGQAQPILYYLGCVELHRAGYAEAKKYFLEYLRNNMKGGRSINLGESLFGLAAVAAALNQVQSAARLAGAGKAIHDAIPYTMLPDDLLEIDPLLQIAREQLGESAFDAFSNEGRAMTMEQAIQLALEV